MKRTRNIVAIALLSVMVVHVHAQEAQSPIIEYPLYNRIDVVSYDGRTTCSTGWEIVADFLYKVANKSFSTNGEKASLESLIFNNVPTIAEFFLLSKLTAQGKVFPSMSTGSLGPVRGGNVTAPYGSFADDFYTTLLANTCMLGNAEERSYGLDISIARRWCIDDDKKVSFVFGLVLPLRQVLHIFDPDFVHGSLFAGENQTLQDFFTDYTGVEDFFLAGILEPKGLVLNERLRKTGVGDLSLFGFLDFIVDDHFLESVQAGLNIIVPTGGRASACRVWDAVLGYGRACALEFFAQCSGGTGSPYLHPYGRFAITAFAPLRHPRRIPRLKSSLVERAPLTSVQGLIIPPKLAQDGFFVDQFSEFDSSVLELADQAVPSTTQFSPQIEITVGGYAYQIFNDRFKIGVFYTYLHQGADSVSVPHNVAGTYNIALLEFRSDQTAHKILWNISYRAPTNNHEMELTFGMQETVAGKNVAQTHEWVFGASIQF